MQLTNSKKISLIHRNLLITLTAFSSCCFIAKADVVDNLAHDVAESRTNAPAGVKNMPLEAIMSNIKVSKGFVAIHLSSEDSGCPFCVESNPIFEVLAEHHAGEMVFWRTGADLYEKIFVSEFARAYHLKSVPVTMIFKDGVLQRQVVGRTPVEELDSLLFNKPPTPIKGVPKKTVPIVSIPSNGAATIGIETIDPGELAERVKNFNGLVAINISSYDARCGYCIEANQYYDALATRYAGRVTFWRSMSYPGWSDAFNLPFFVDQEIHDVPKLLLFKDGVLINKTSGFLTTNAIERNLFYTYSK